MNATGAGAETSGRSTVVDAILAFVVFYLVTTVAIILLQPPQGEAAEAVTARLELSATAMLVGLVALVIYALVAPPRVAAFRRGVLPRTAAIYSVFLLAWVPLTFFAYPLALEWLGVELSIQPQLHYFVREPATSWGFWVMTLVACIGAPIGEEILFRGYLQGVCKTVMPVWLAVVVTGALFGLVHGVEYALPLGLLGMLFGLLRERYRCLEAAVFAHALHNSLTIAVSCTFPETMG